MSDLIHSTAAELGTLIARREVSSEEVTRAHLDRIEQVDGPVHAFLAEHALSAGYALAAQATRITLPRTGAAGSIGVITMHTDMSGMLAQKGVAVTLIHAGAKKADGNPYAALPDGIRDRLQAELPQLDVPRLDTLVTLSDARGTRLGKTRTLYDTRVPRWDEVVDIDCPTAQWISATVWRRSLHGEPHLLGRLADCGQPDQALIAFDAFLSRLPAGVQVFSLFDANPSLLDLLVFGRRAGLGAADYVRALSADTRPKVSEDALNRATELALDPFEPKANPENPYTLHAELQESMNDLAGIIRKEGELQEALTKIDELKKRYANVAVEGGRVFNPGWHLAIDLRNMLLVSECVAKAALQRTESRGGHTRDDHPQMDRTWRNKLLVCKTVDGAGDKPGDPVVPDVVVTPEEQPVMRPDLLATFELSELEKYYTDDQLAEHPDRKG